MKTEKTVKLTISKPRDTFNISVPLDMKVNDVMGVLWFLYTLLDVMRKTKPDAEEHEYACTDDFKSWVKDYLNTSMENIAHDLISTSYMYKQNNKKNGRAMSGGCLLVTGWSSGTDGQKIQTIFGEELNAFLDGEVDFRGMFEKHFESVDRWIEENKDTL